MQKVCEGELQSIGGGSKGLSFPLSSVFGMLEWQMGRQSGTRSSPGEWTDKLSQAPTFSRLLPADRCFDWFVVVRRGPARESDEGRR